jgi:hypothetical protein
MERAVIEDAKSAAQATPVAGPKKPYTAPAILFTTKVEARAVLCSKADGNCTLGPVSS